jgi:hypothetical protein
LFDILTVMGEYQTVCSMMALFEVPVPGGDGFPDITGEECDGRIRRVRRLMGCPEPDVAKYDQLLTSAQEAGTRKS